MTYFILGILSTIIIEAIIVVFIIKTGWYPKEK